MREKRWSIAIAVALGVLLLIPTAAPAGEEDQTRMQSLEERLMALEDKLEASESTVAAQREMLQRQVPEVNQGSGLDAFFSDLEFGGHVGASYVYNFNNPDTNPAAQSRFQFQTDHNSFSLDAVKLEMGKAASEPGSGGFQIDLLFGENANVLGSLTPSNGGRFFNAVPTDADGDGFFEAGETLASSRGPGDTGVFVQEAFVSYNYDGVMLQAGKFETLLGFEVLDSPANPNVTHGLLFTWAIPLYHTGLLASGSFGEGISWAAGVTNGFNNANDWGDNKGVLGRIGWADDATSVTLNAFVGSENTRVSATKGGVTVGDNNNRMQIYDLVATTSPSEGLDLWLNVDYGYHELEPDITDITLPVDEDAEWVGVAAGVKVALTEKTHVAIRGEYLHDDGGTRLGVTSVPGFEEIDMTSATVTLGHQLTDNVLARLEYRHDTFDQRGANAGTGNNHSKHDGNFDNQQDVGLVEFTYLFD